MPIRPAASVPDPETLALLALAEVAGDPGLGPRFLDLSGLDAATLRAHAGDRTMLAAVIAFLAANEADLVRVAQALDVRAQDLADAGAKLAA